jgi:predicted transcriptional regulator
MPNTATVCFKTTPTHFAILQGLAIARRTTVSALVRETVEEALDLEGQMAKIARYLREESAGLEGTAGGGL